MQNDVMHDVLYENSAEQCIFLSLGTVKLGIENKNYKHLTKI